MIPSTISGSSSSLDDTAILFQQLKDTFITTSSTNMLSNAMDNVGGGGSVVTTSTTTTTTTTHEQQEKKDTEFTCKGFFTVLANVWVPEESDENNVTCTSTYDKFREQLDEHNSQFLKMNTTMIIFTTWTTNQLQEPGCTLDQYPALQQVQFDPVSLLRETITETIKTSPTLTNKNRNVTEVTDTILNYIQNWQYQNDTRHNHLVTRLSDIFRIVLAYKHQLAYTDLDMVYLSNDKRIYLSESNVAVPIWSEEKGAFEIQNSGFCFNSMQLQVLLQNAIQLIINKGPRQLTKKVYKYTDLGPNLLQHSIQKMMKFGPIRLYYTMCDEDWEENVIIKKAKNYDGGFVWLHYDKSIRKSNWYNNQKGNDKNLMTFPGLVKSIRTKLNAPTYEELFVTP